MARNGHRGVRVNTCDNRGCPLAVSKIAFTQINLHKSREAAAQLTSTLARVHTGVALVQEPGLHDALVKGLANCGTVFQLAGASARACVVIRGLDAELVPKHTSRDLTVVKVKYQTGVGTGKEMLVASAYLHGLRDVPTQELKALMEDENLRGLDLIIGCDSNSHHFLWGDKSCDERGHKLIEFLDQFDLDVVNRDSVPTFSTGRGETVIDLTLCSFSTTGSIRDWHVSKDVSLSDHRYIKFWLEGRGASPVYRRNPRKTDWGKYTDSLKTRMGDFPSDFSSTELIDKAVRHLEASVISSFKDSCPLRKKSEKSGDPWWDNHLDQLRKKVRKLFRQQKRDAVKYRSLYLAQLTSYKSEIRKKRYKGWRNFCGEVESIPGTSRLLKVLSRDTYATGWVKRPDGTFPESSRENLEILFKTHFPDFNKNYPQNLLACTGGRGRVDWATAQKAVGQGRVSWAVGSFSPYKSPGPDGIYPVLLQRGLDVLETPLTKIFRACIAHGFVPVNWRKSRVAFIPKGGRVGHSLPKDYRPISLMSFVVKTLERLVNRKMEEQLIQRPLSDAQHAYRSGRSTETALHQVVGYVEQGMRGRGSVLGVLIDIVGAFNETPLDAIVKGAHEHAIHGTIVRWLKELLSKRLVHSEHGLAKMTGQVRRGCPQGGVLSPKLWCLAVDGLLEELANAGFMVVGYSDDIIILTRGHDVSHIVNKTQVALSIVENWCARVGLTVNPDKTECILFTRKRSLEGLVGPTFYGKALNFAEKVKYLGVMLDRKLNWKTHIEYIAKKFLAGYWLCKRTLGQTWGLRPKMVKWIYKAVLLPRLTYGSLVWWPRSNLVTAKGLLDRLQSMMLRCVTGSTRTTPRAAISVAAGVFPLDVEIKRTAALAAARLKALGEWKGGCGGHGAITGFECLSQLPATSDRTLVDLSFVKRFSVSATSREEWINGTHPALEGTLAFFTDGSKQNGNTGSGSWEPNTGTALIGSAGPTATVFQSEILAIKICVEDLKRRRMFGQNISICSDSWAALCALNAPTVQSKLVGECKKALNFLGRVNGIRLLWVPAHVGIPGNERADELAKRGTLLREPTENVGSPWCETVLGIKRWAESQWQDLWSNSEGCRQSKQALGPDALYKYSEELLGLSRKECATVMGWMTGHCHFNRHLRPPNLVFKPCRFCNVDNESCEHILRVCPAVMERRRRHLGLLETGDIRPLALLRFLKALGLVDDEEGPSHS